MRLCIVGLRDYTGGSLGTQPTRAGDGVSLYAFQFEPDRMLAYYIVFALWLFGLYVWVRVDRSMDRYALDAASQDEDAAASVGIDVTREKLKITALSSAMCALGGAIFAQYQMYIGPDTIAGLGLSLNMVFAVIAGGMWVLLGPTVGAVFTQLLAEGLRVAIQGSATLKSLLGSSALALDQMIYGLLLVLFIIYMPRGILGTYMNWRQGANVLRCRGPYHRAAAGLIRPDPLADALHASVNVLVPLGHVLCKARFRSLVSTAGLDAAGSQRCCRPFGDGDIVDVARLGLLVDNELTRALSHVSNRPSRHAWNGPGRSQICAPVADPAMAVRKTAQVSKTPRRRLDNTRIMISP